MLSTLYSIVNPREIWTLLLLLFSQWEKRKGYYLSVPRGITEGKWQKKNTACFEDKSIRRLDQGD